jgi:hypothetical protein
MKTWHFEMGFAAALLGGVALWRGTWLDGLGALAVFLSFGHTTIAERMRERQQSITVRVAGGTAVQDGVIFHLPYQEVTLGSAHIVSCHRLLTRYLVGKEVAWVAFFLLTKSYPALVGCGLFLLYPVWRRYWRKVHPLEAS